MFRTYHDTVRTPKEAEKALKTEVFYHCNMCDKGGWPSENDVEIHRKESHFVALHDYSSQHRDRFCTVCMTLQDSYEALIKHIKSRHLLSSPNAKRVERIIYICDICSNIFFNKGVLETHMLYSHVSIKRRAKLYITCPKCSKTCHVKSTWFHLQLHDIPSVSLCDICLLNFPNRAELYKHIETHKGYYKCEPCGYSSTQELPYRMHINKHNEQDTPNVEVPLEVLNVIFKKHKITISRYNVHNAIKGLNLPSFVEICTLCREICLSHLETVMHFLRVHKYDSSDKKKHRCVCGEEFYNKVVLKQHVLRMRGAHQSVEDCNGKELKRGAGPSILAKILTIPQKKLKLEHTEDQEPTSVLHADDEE